MYKASRKEKNAGDHHRHSHHTHSKKQLHEQEPDEAANASLPAPPESLNKSQRERKIEIDNQCEHDDENHRRNTESQDKRLQKDFLDHWMREEEKHPDLDSNRPKKHVEIDCVDNDTSSNCMTNKNALSAAGRLSSRLSNQNSNMSAMPRGELLKIDDDKSVDKAEKLERLSLANVVKDLDASFEDLDQELGACSQLLTIDRKRSRTLNSKRVSELTSFNEGRASVVADEMEKSERPKTKENNANRQSRWGDGPLDQKKAQMNNDDDERSQGSANSSTSF